MRKAILFGVALVFSIATCSQTGSNTQVAYEIKHSVYFADGSLDEYTAIKWNNAYTRIDNETRYSASGAMLEQVDFDYNEDKGYKTAKTTKDVESRLKNKTTYLYNTQGQLYRESLIDNKGIVISFYEYSYDSRGNQISRVMRNRKGERLAETVYTYDSSGKMLTSETKDAGDRKISATKYTYDNQGNLINQQVTNAEGRVTSVTTSVFQAGREMKNEIASPDGSIQMRITNEYGRNNELTKKTIENFQGDSKQFIQYEYTFRSAPRR